MSAEYFDVLKEVMTWLGKKESTFFLGQATEYPGSPLFSSLADVPKEKKLELPVIEDDQMGITIGLALNNFIPVSIYPRMDFLMCAMNQLVNHLDKIPDMTGEFKMGIIIRTQVGNTQPIWPGLQHCGDYSEGLGKMLKNVKVIKIAGPDNIESSYRHAFERAKRGRPSLVVEPPQGISTKTFHRVMVGADDRSAPKTEHFH